MRNKIFSKQKKKNDGWTYMETLIVIAIVLILTVSVGIVGITSVTKAKIAAAKTQIESFCIALESYYIDCGNYPTTEQGLLALYTKPEMEPVSDNWYGPYIYKEPPKDPWGNVYVYEEPDTDDDLYKIICYGADGKEGGDGKRKDISNLENN